jgi:alpha-L-fucosidase
MLEQIEVRQKAIRKTLAKKLELSKNYSIHELIAEIEMFKKDNEEDELVEDEVYKLVELGQEIRRNFVVSDAKVDEIIDKKEARNLPVEYRKISKKELIEIETYRFLNKYGYDIELGKSEPPYQDTMANEIYRIIEYIDSSKIL